MSRNKPKYTPFGLWVKKVLLEVGMDQRDLAKEIGVQENFLSDVLTGRKQGYDYTDKIINVLTKEKSISSAG